MEFFRHLTEEGHNGFLKDISVKIIDRLTGGNRMRKSFWQYRLDSFAPKGLNTRQVDTWISFFLRFGCCVVLILALSLSLGIHAVLLGISFCPSALGSFYRLFCFTHVISSSCETDKAADFSGSCFCASCDLSSADKRFTLRLHLVLGRARL